MSLLGVCYVQGSKSQRSEKITLLCDREINHAAVCYDMTDRVTGGCDIVREIMQDFYHDRLQSKAVVISRGNAWERCFRC